MVELLPIVAEAAALNEQKALAAIYRDRLNHEEAAVALIRLRSIEPELPAPFM